MTRTIDTLIHAQICQISTCQTVELFSFKSGVAAGWAEGAALAGAISLANYCCILGTITSDGPLRGSVGNSQVELAVDAMSHLRATDLRERPACVSRAVNEYVSQSSKSQARCVQSAWCGLAAGRIQYAIVPI